MPRAGLSTAKVVEVAAGIADETGWDRLTLAAVAERCGVRLPSLYRHITSLDGLRAEISVLGLHELEQALRRAVLGKAGGDAVRALAHAYREYAQARPGCYAATLGAPAGEHPAHQRAAADVLYVVEAALAGYGLAGDDQTDAVRALRAALHGFVALEADHGFALPLDTSRSFDRLVEGLDLMLAHWAQATANL